ncbi:hypothetical protein BN1723_003236, partial [Verticillium longisporum]
FTPMRVGHVRSCLKSRGLEHQDFEFRSPKLPRVYKLGPANGGPPVGYGIHGTHSGENLQNLSMLLFIPVTSSTRGMSVVQRFTSRRSFSCYRNRISCTPNIRMRQKEVMHDPAVPSYKTRFRSLSIEKSTWAFRLRLTPLTRRSHGSSGSWSISISQYSMPFAEVVV